MADISTISTNAPTTTRNLERRRLGFPTLAISASFGAVFRLVGDAFGMAYAEPYTNRRRQPQSAADDGQEGRDPSW